MQHVKATIYLRCRTAPTCVCAYARNLKSFFVHAKTNLHEHFQITPVKDAIDVINRKSSAVLNYQPRLVLIDGPQKR
jgi:hypothetical protein